MSATRRSSIRYHLQQKHHHHSNNPSFSSTLLEEIYRSFDEDRDIPPTDTAMKKSSSCCMDRERDVYYRSSPGNRSFVVIDRWIQNEKFNLRQKSAPSAVHSDVRRINHSSSTSSSDSSSGIGGFSSSDTESVYGSGKVKQKSTKPRKPIRTAENLAEFHRKNYSNEIPAKCKKNKEGILQRRALKLYSDLKKVKQPISPGGKLANFLNSLFHSSASKKPNISSSTSLRPLSNGLKLERETPSTATTRSCLSKTPSSAGRFERRSVRFVDDESSRDRKCDEEFKLQINEKHRRVEEAAKALLTNYQLNNNNRKELTVNIVADNRKFDHNICNFEEEDDGEDEEDGDDLSCCSSDLFELENLLEIGIVDRYREELPVYETTHVHTNKAIANGFIL